VEFLGIGYQELILVLVLMLVVVGPERLPTVAYQIGRAVRTMQRYARSVRDEFSDEIGYLEDQYKTVKGEVDNMQSELRKEQLKLNTEMREATAEMRESTAVALPPLLPEGQPAVAAEASAPVNGHVAEQSTNGAVSSGGTNGSEPAKAAEPDAGAGKPPLVF
jgi:sec-independent protein translocase protein TatB